MGEIGQPDAQWVGVLDVRGQVLKFSVKVTAAAVRLLLRCSVSHLAF